MALGIGGGDNLLKKAAKAGVGAAITAATGNAQAGQFAAKVAGSAFDIASSALQQPQQPGQQVGSQQAPQQKAAAQKVLVVPREIKVGEVVYRVVDQQSTLMG